jgi:mono/diheme cytochrome c family protein
MWATNLKVFLVVIGTVAVYTLLANAIPQVESAVPQELTLSAEASAEELVAAGEQIYAGAGGCTACHGLGTRAPNLLTDQGGTGLIGERCNQRDPALTCKEYLHQALVSPAEHVVEGFEAIMPDMSRTLSPGEVWALVAYLESLGGVVTVTPEDVQVLATTPAEAPGGIPTPPQSATLEPSEIIAANGCMACHKLGAEGGVIGPDLSTVGARLDVNEIRTAILDPNADISAGYEAFAGTMPATMGQTLSAAQLEALVRFLAEQR